MHVVLIAAATADGKIARHANELANWTSKEDKRFFVKETKRCGVMIMGRRTYDTINRPLPERLTMVLTLDPPSSDPIPGKVEYTAKPLPELLQELEERGFTSCAIAGGATVYRQFLQQGLVDEILLTIEPRLFGAGIGLLGDQDCEVELELTGTEQLNPDVIMLRYNVKKPTQED